MSDQTAVPFSLRTEILASTDGEPVAVHHLGGDGPPLVLGHGNGLNAGMWAAAVPHLRERFSCYGVDLRGHGVCRPVDPDYAITWEQFAADVITVIDHLGGPVAYAGHSLGGATGTEATLQRPDLISGLWLFEPILFTADRPAADGPSMLVEATVRRRMEFDSVDDAVNRLGSKPPFNRCDPVAVREYLTIGTFPVPGGVRLSCDRKDEARVFAGTSPVDFDRLAGVSVPVRVVRGGSADAANAGPADFAPLVAKVFGVDLEEHAPLSHFGPMEDGALIARSIIDHFGA
ncbi:MAG: alpha/beta fold hydrolase [Acidimicrobiales bacterium]